MLQPLYNQAQNSKEAKNIFLKNKTEGHAGVWFDKFYTYQIFDHTGQLENNEKQYKDKKTDEKKQFLQEFYGQQGTRQCGNPSALHVHAVSQRALCKAQNGIARIYENDWLMAIGLGNSHPLENGMLWHPTLGVPYFQGSTVKGMAKALMEKWGADPLLIKRWFGSVNLLTSPNFKDKGKIFGDELDDKLKQQLEADATGAFIFLDAIPIEPVMLKKSLVTPHYGKWYEKGDSQPMDTDVQPGDWQSPVPVSFLAVEKAVMQFAVMPRLGADVEEGEIEQISNVITLALEHLGIGAKTATGYGSMTFDRKSDGYYEEKASEYEQQAREQAKFTEMMISASQLKQELLKTSKDGDWGNQNKFTQVIDMWLDKLEEHPNDKGAINAYIEIFKKHYSNQWNNPSKINKKKPQQKAWVERLKSLSK